MSLSCGHESRTLGPRESITDNNHTSFLNRLKLKTFPVALPLYEVILLKKDLCVNPKCSSLFFSFYLRVHRPLRVITDRPYMWSV